jgi:hypothetical protein
VSHGSTEDDKMAINETATGANSVAVTGTATGTESVGVVGKGETHGMQGQGGAVGVWGQGATWHGVVGLSHSTTGGVGVYGHHATGGTGVVGESKGWMGVYGKSESTTGGAGVMGEGDPSPGVIGKSTKWIGVYGETAGIENGPAGVWGEHKGAGCGVKAVSKDGVGLAAYSAGHEAVHAESRAAGTAAIAAFHLNPDGTGAAVFAKKEGARGHAGFFDGNVWVSGELGVGKDIVLANADCAEHFDVAEMASADPGTVMVVGHEGALRESDQAYDKRVAGVISGAGNYKPGIVLDKQPSQANRLPVALLGKTYCKVDAEFGPIDVGDLLTTSPTSGHAMKAADPAKAFGAVIGKALRPHNSGRGLIPILIALQ